MSDPLRYLPPEVRDAILRHAQMGLPMGTSEAAYYVDRYPDLASALWRGTEEMDDILNDTRYRDDGTERPQE